MELRHPRYFVAVAEELNVRQAATRLHLSQPQLSRQIHDLEDEVGTKLFVHSQSGMRLTEAGPTFLKEARIIALMIVLPAPILNFEAVEKILQLLLSGLH